MTFILAVHFTSKIILAADTRTINIKTGKCCDTSKKIIKTKYGLITGFGDKGLLDYLKEEFSKLTSICNVDLVNYFKEKREDLMKRAEVCCVKHSELTMSFKEHNQKNKYLSLVQFDEKDIEHIQDNLYSHRPTSGWSKEKDWPYLQKYIDCVHLKDVGENKDINTSLNVFHKKIFPIFCHFGSKYNSMSKYVQYGIHTKENEIHVTDIVQSIDQYPTIIK